jgi:Malectin domain
VVSVWKGCKSHTAIHFILKRRSVKSANSRQFNVVIEGSTFLSNYDIFAEVGRFHAVTKTKKVLVTDGALTINFLSVIQNAKISAIQVTGPGL